MSPKIPLSLRRSLLSPKIPTFVIFFQKLFIIYCMFHFLFVAIFALIIICLQDVLENDDIKLDWMFKVSLIFDIIKVCVNSYFI